MQNAFKLPLKLFFFFIIWDKEREKKNNPYVNFLCLLLVNTKKTEK